MCFWWGECFLMGPVLTESCVQQRNLQILIIGNEEIQGYIHGYEAQTRIITGLYEKRIGIIHGTHGTEKGEEKLEGNRCAKKKS